MLLLLVLLLLVPHDHLPASAALIQPKIRQHRLTLWDDRLNLRLDRLDRRLGPAGRLDHLHGALLPRLFTARRAADVHAIQPFPGLEHQPAGAVLAVLLDLLLLQHAEGLAGEVAGGAALYVPLRIEILLILLCPYMVDGTVQWNQIATLGINISLRLRGLASIKIVPIRF